jgi:hypothetical protein
MYTVFKLRNYMRTFLSTAKIEQKCYGTVKNSFFNCYFCYICTPIWENYIITT